MTYGVVILSLLVQGLTMPWLLRRVGLGSLEDTRLTYDVARAHVAVSDGGLTELDHLAATHAAAPEVLDALRERYRTRQDESRKQLLALHREQSELAREEAASTVRHLLHTERSQITARFHDGRLRRDAYEQLVADVDQRLDRLDSGKYEDVRDLILPVAQAAPERES
jgi:CPA1 family monovalent cation:H+ antiporter